MEWIHIDPPVRPYTEVEKRIIELLDQGVPWWRIASRLHISNEQCKETICNIHEKESIRMAKLTEEQQKEVFRLYHEEKLTYDEIAARFDVSKSTIGNIITRYYKKKTGINEDFDAAVTDMIAEQKSENAEPEAVIAEPTPTPKDKLPECVVTALVYRLACIEEEIQHFRAEIDKLEAEHEQLAKWKEAHDD